MGRKQIETALVDTLAGQKWPINARELARVNLLGLHETWDALDRLVADGRVVLTYNGASAVYSLPASP